MNALALLGLFATSPVVPGGDARPVDVIEAFRAADPSGYTDALGRVRAAPDFVLEGRALRRLGALHLADALRQVPGLSLSRDTRGRWRVAQRGLRAARRVTIYVDGARADDPWTGQGPLTMPLDLIERVELRRGPLPDRPGANLVVDVFTRARAGAEFRAYGGGFETLGTAGSAAGALGPWAVSGGLAGYWTQGPRVPVVEDAFTPQGLVDRALVTRADALRAHGAVRARGPLPVGELALSLRAEGADAGPWLGYFDTVDDAGGSRALNLQGRAAWRWPVALPLEVRAGLEWLQGFAENTHQVAPAGLARADVDGDGVDERFGGGIIARETVASARAAADAAFALALGGGHELEGAGRVSLALNTDYALEMNRDLVGAAQPLGPVDGLAPRAADASRLRARASLTDRWAATPRLDLAGALSVETLSDEVLDPVDHLGGALFAAWRPAAGLELGARAARGLVAPTLEERHSEVALAHTDISTGGYLGDPDVRAEVRTTNELWVRYTSAALEVRSGVFAEQTARAIEAIDDNGNVERTTNRGDAAVVGAELWGRARLGPGRVFAQLSWFRGVFVAGGCQVLGADNPCSLLTETPQLRADLGGELPVGVGRLGAWVELGSERRNNRRTDLERLRPFQTPAYALLNLGFESNPAWGMRLFAQVQNLMDAAHVDDVPRPDRLPGLLPRGGVRFLGGLSLELDDR